MMFAGGAHDLQGVPRFATAAVAAARGTRAAARYAADIAGGRSRSARRGAGGGPAAARRPMGTRVLGSELAELAELVRPGGPCGARRALPVGDDRWPAGAERKTVAVVAG
ncbi:hypothetical protein [Streptomyces sp. NPDC058295]|uniref:hypothetical protein n=1 Tax=Streptomyces sp. NPDC058295 TaxID=3346431 RepID=UPI0036E03413